MGKLDFDWPSRVTSIDRTCGERVLKAEKLWMENPWGFPCLWTAASFVHPDPLVLKVSLIVSFTEHKRRGRRDHGNFMGSGYRLLQTPVCTVISYKTHSRL